MTIVLRIMLIFASLMTFLGIVKKVRTAKVQIEMALFWIIFSGVLFLISVFPQIVEFIADIIGVYSVPNCIFLVVIFILLIHQFMNSIKISHMEQKINNLTQELAVRELKEKE